MSFFRGFHLQTLPPVSKSVPVLFWWASVFSALLWLPQALNQMGSHDTIMLYLSENHVDHQARTREII